MGRPRALKSLTERGRLRVRFLAAAAAAAAAAAETLRLRTAGKPDAKPGGKPDGKPDGEPPPPPYLPLGVLVRYSAEPARSWIEPDPGILQPTNQPTNQQKFGSTR